MKNPWEEISLEDYENHMKLDSVFQLQALNEMMKGQLGDYPASRVMILGVAGGNGLEHIREDRVEKVYGVDVNATYLEAATARHPNLTGVLECLRVDLTKDPGGLPEADLVIADLLVEYIGYESFQRAVRRVRPRWVSCVIQINTEDGWVSDSPYLHAFDKLERVHRQMEERALERAMGEIGCQTVKTLERGLPNGKKFVRIDFERAGRRTRV
nr:class I SAM-dependent methyltransferase [uncultured Oscillibacter sp.]